MCHKLFETVKNTYCDSVINFVTHFVTPEILTLYLECFHFKEWFGQFMKSIEKLFFVVVILTCLCETGQVNDKMWRAFWWSCLFLVILSFLSWVPRSADAFQSCPSICTCKWKTGKTQINNKYMVLLSWFGKTFFPLHSSRASRVVGPCKAAVNTTFNFMPEKVVKNSY